MVEGKPGNGSGPPSAALGAPRGVPAAAPGPDPVVLAELLAVLLKSCAVYPPDHPRVREPAVQLAELLGHCIDAPNWFRVRVRGDDLVIGARVIDVQHPLVRWMWSRLREARLAGVEFGPRVDPESLMEFAVVLNDCSPLTGRTFDSCWPANHAKIRPLELVFAGGYGGQAGDDPPDAPVGPPATGSAGTGAQDVWKLDVVRQLANDRRVQDRLQSIERQCAAARQEGPVASIDLVAGIVDLLPIEVAGNLEEAGHVVTSALETVQRAVSELGDEGNAVTDAELTRTALNVAKKYFGKSANGTRIEPGLPTGRAEDDLITADLGQLLAEFELLPVRQQPLPPVAALRADAPAMAAELSGVYLHVLSAAERPETREALARVLPRTLRALRRQDDGVLETYLGDGAATDPRTRFELLTFLCEHGCEEMVRSREFLTPQLFEATFPRALPLYARVLGGELRGLDVLRRSLAAVGARRLTEGAEQLARSGELLQAAVQAAILALGADVAMPFVQRMVRHLTPDERSRVVVFLRSLPLPDAEVAALRCIEPPSALPVRYLEDVCRIAVTRAEDADTRRLSSRLLRAYVNREDVPLERRLVAIAGLRHHTDPETQTLLRLLAQTGRFTQHGVEARAVRRQAREALSRIVRPGGGE